MTLHAPRPIPPQSPAYIWQRAGWPALNVQDALLAEALHQARLEQGRLLGQLEAIGHLQALEVGRDIWVRETLATAAIEGERLDLAAVRSSVARRMG
jgi:Fic family protein